MTDKDQLLCHSLSANYMDGNFIQLIYYSPNRFAIIGLTSNTDMHPSFGIVLNGTCDVIAGKYGLLETMVYACSLCEK